MMKKTVIGTSSIIFTLLITIIPASIVFAEITTPPTKGGKMLEDMINAESARSAELNVKLNPELGIVHTLQRHSVGNAVKLLQQFLKVYGVYPEGLITGYFGPLTKQAVKKFQEKELIDPIGIAGPKTRARIVEISKQKVTASLTASVSTSASVPLPVSATSTSPISSIHTQNSVPEITNAVLATDIAENGAAIAPAVSFINTIKNIYAVLSLQNTAQDTKIAYIRYYGDTYVDSEISHPSRSDLRYFHFQWSLKPGNNRLAGNYSIVFYINDKRAKTIQYTIY